MRVLWVCNIMLPAVAEQLHRETSNKEGWVLGLADVVLQRQQENKIELAVAFPAPKEIASERVCKGECSLAGGSFLWYGFWEDTRQPHLYAPELEPQMRYILEDFQPEVVHCFGTEYPHTLAVCRVISDKNRLLVGIQGLCKWCAEAYYADLPEEVIRGVTLRDFLKRDNLVSQREKFARRGETEQEIIRLAGNVTGRTAWDRRYTAECNPDARYFEMNETLRPNFYEGEWVREKAEPHSIFLSQGDYPLKGLHYMLLALPKICERYPDAKVCVAGNSIIRDGGVTDRLKIGTYGRYLCGLIGQTKAEKRLHFLGKLDADRMKEQYLKSSLFVCCSSVENSPNSLGEAMLLGVPCVSANVGGIGSLFAQGRDGILYDGFDSGAENGLYEVADRLAAAVLEMWSDDGKADEYRRNAREHAKRTHDREKNYAALIEIYVRIAEGTAK